MCGYVSIDAYRVLCCCVCMLEACRVWVLKACSVCGCLRLRWLEACRVCGCQILVGCRRVARALQCVGACRVCASKACRVCATKACSVCGSVRFVGCQKLVVCGCLRLEGCVDDLRLVDAFVCMHT